MLEHVLQTYRILPFEVKGKAKEQGSSFSQDFIAALGRDGYICFGCARMLTITGFFLYHEIQKAVKSVNSAFIWILASIYIPYDSRFKLGPCNYAWPVSSRWQRINRS